MPRRSRASAARLTVKAMGLRQAAGPGPAVAWCNRPELKSKLICDAWLGKSDTRGITHLSDGSGWLYCTIRSIGDGPLPQEPSKVDENSREQLWSAESLVKSISGLEVAYRDLLMSC